MNETSTAASVAQYFPTVVIGAGQAGLVAGYHLKRAGIDYTILEADARVGDVWRRRYDGLRLFSVPRYASLPGLRIQPTDGLFPTRDDMADYLERYADSFALPVRLGHRVQRVSSRQDGFLVETSQGRFVTDQVVVTTGAYQRPITPALAGSLNPAVRQLHSIGYRNASQFAPGPVLVVGAANSGTDVALEAAASGHDVVLAGRHPGQVPVDIDTPLGRSTLPLVMFAFRHVLTLRTPIGRAARERMRGHGINLVRNKLADLDTAGVRRVGRIESVSDGWPVTADGEVLRPSTVVWCTGASPDFTFLDLPFADEDGEVVHLRGVSTTVPGLFYLGLEFQFAAASGTIQGLDRDMRYLLRHLRRGMAGRIGESAEVEAVGARGA